MSAVPIPCGHAGSWTTLCERCRRRTPESSGSVWHPGMSRRPDSTTCAEGAGCGPTRGFPPRRRRRAGRLTARTYAAPGADPTDEEQGNVGDGRAADAAGRIRDAGLGGARNGLGIVDQRPAATRLPALPPVHGLVVLPSLSVIALRCPPHRARNGHAGATPCKHRAACRPAPAGGVELHGLSAGAGGGRSLLVDRLYCWR
jgi:hypothetical protein